MSKRKNGPGISPWRMSREDNIPYGRLRRAIDAGEVETVIFGGVEIIKQAERRRIHKLLGIEISSKDDRAA